MVMNVFDHSPSDREPVVGGCTATDLIQDEERARGGVMQNVCGFDHLHHEGGLPRVDLILGANAGEDAIYQPNLRRIGRDEGADLRHENDQRGLAQISALPTHIGSSDDAYDLAFFEDDIVGDVTFAM